MTMTDEALQHCLENERRARERLVGLLLEQNTLFHRMCAECDEMRRIDVLVHEEVTRLNEPHSELDTPADKVELEIASLRVQVVSLRAELHRTQEEAQANRAAVAALSPKPASSAQSGTSKKSSRFAKQLASPKRAGHGGNPSCAGACADEGNDLNAIQLEATEGLLGRWQSTSPIRPGRTAHTQNEASHRFPSKIRPAGMGGKHAMGSDSSRQVFTFAQKEGLNEIGSNHRAADNIIPSPSKRHNGAITPLLLLQPVASSWRPVEPSQSSPPATVPGSTASSDDTASQEVAQMEHFSKAGNNVAGSDDSLERPSRVLNGSMEEFWNELLQRPIFQSDLTPDAYSPLVAGSMPMTSALEGVRRAVQQKVTSLQGRIDELKALLNSPPKLDRQETFSYYQFLRYLLALCSSLHRLLSLPLREDSYGLYLEASRLCGKPIAAIALGSSPMAEALFGGMSRRASIDTAAQVRMAQRTAMVSAVNDFCDMPSEAGLHRTIEVISASLHRILAHNTRPQTISITSSSSAPQLKTPPANCAKVLRDAAEMRSAGAAAVALPFRLPPSPNLPMWLHDATIHLKVHDRTLSRPRSCSGDGNSRRQRRLNTSGDDSNHEKKRSPDSLPKFSPSGRILAPSPKLRDSPRLSHRHHAARLRKGKKPSADRIPQVHIQAIGDSIPSCMRASPMCQ